MVLQGHNRGPGGVDGLGLVMGLVDMAKLSYHNYFLFLNITILCHVGFSILTNFPIIKTYNYNITITKFKIGWWIFRPKWARIKKSLPKMRTKIHITNTHNIKIK